jgi:hypothetical protein
MSETIRTNRARHDKGPQDAVPTDAVPTQQLRAALAATCEVPNYDVESKRFSHIELAHVAATALGVDLGAELCGRGDSDRGRKTRLLDRVAAHVDEPPTARRKCSQRQLERLCRCVGLDPAAIIDNPVTEAER